LTAAGCGGGPNPLDYSEAKVHGTVTYNGKPLKTGMIRFIPAGKVTHGQVAGKPIFAKIEDGKYSIVPAKEKGKGATVGTNLVQITSMRGTGRMLTTSSESGKEKEEEQIQFIPAKYNTLSSKNPEMTVDIKEGDNKFDFDLKK